MDITIKKSAGTWCALGMLAMRCRVLMRSTRGIERRRNQQEDGGMETVLKQGRGAWLVLCAVSAFGLAPTVQAASFDCAKASTIVEQLICDTTELSRLDEALGETYLAAQKSSKRVEQLRIEQRRWLAHRNACTSKKCVRDAYLDQLERLELAMPMPSEPYSDREPDYQPFKSGYQRFRLLRGANKEVCVAHLVLLRATYFNLPPYCGRSEPEGVPGFESLPLVRLDDGSTMWTNQTLGTLLSDKPELVRVPAEPSPASREFVEEVRRLPLAIAPSTFEPPIDIDNDGIPDRIAYWPDYNYKDCGRESGINKDGSFLRGTRHGLALDVQGRVDVMRTRTLFAHPFPYVIEQREKNTGKTTSVELTRYRPLAHMMTFTKYRGTFYFSGMMASYGWGDFEDKRKSDPTLADTLAVYENRNGKTTLQCEIRWTPMQQTQLTRSK